jgi:hypothetical protein
MITVRPWRQPTRQAAHHAPPPINRKHAVIKRIAWTLVPLASAGLLAFAPFLYLRLTRRTRKDSGLLAGSIAAVAIEVVMLALVGNDTIEGIPDFFGGVYITVLAVVAAILTWIEMRPGKETAALPGRAYL